MAASIARRLCSSSTGSTQIRTRRYPVRRIAVKSSATFKGRRSRHNQSLARVRILPGLHSEGPHARLAAGHKIRYRLRLPFSLRATPKADNLAKLLFSRRLSVKMDLGRRRLRPQVGYTSPNQHPLALLIGSIVGRHSLELQLGAEARGHLFQ